MPATITTYSGTPVVGGLLGKAVTITAGSKLAFESYYEEMFRLYIQWPDRVEQNNTNFLTSGWNFIYFYTNSPITCSRYKLWFSEDFQSGSRATYNFKILAGINEARASYQTLADESLSVPYSKNYGSDSIMVSGSFPPTTVQFFELKFLGRDWGMHTDGPRVCGIEIS